MKVLVLDDTDQLSIFWRLGSLISGADVVIRASSWADAYAWLTALERKPEPLHLQVWGHGFSGAPLIDGLRVHLPALSRALGPLTPDDTVWFRSCDVARGVGGQTFMFAAANTLGCSVIAHCAVVSAPNPLWQREVVGLRPKQQPWWPADGAGLPGCSTLRMNPPPFAFRD